MQRVFFLNRFYWPDETATAQLLTDLAEALASRGHAVSVIASRVRGGPVPPTEERNGVRIIRVGSTRATGPGLGAKALDFATFWLGALRCLARRAGHNDVVVVLTDPPLIGVGAAVVARLRGARCIHWIQDIYPEVAIAVSGRRALGALTPVRDTAWRRAEACVTLGSDMAGVVAAAGVPAGRIRVIANWAPAGLGSAPAGDVADIRAAWGSEGKFVVVYSGNLGRVHDLGPVLDAAEALRPDPRIVIVFAGTGALRPALEAEAARRGLGGVHFRGPQPRRLLAGALAAGDLHLVTLRPGCERFVFPSKVYGVAAAGRPVVFVGPRGSEVARLIVDGGFGLAFERHETAALAAAILHLAADPAARAILSAAALRFAVSCGGAAASADQWARLLASTSGPT